MGLSIDLSQTTCPLGPWSGADVASAVARPVLSVEVEHRTIVPIKGRVLAIAVDPGTLAPSRSSSTRRIRLPEHFGRRVFLRGVAEVGSALPRVDLVWLQ